MLRENQRILFYDGDCGLCNRSLRFLMKRDKNHLLRFAPLQGETAQDLLDADLRQSLSTIVYLRPADEPLLRSTAVLRALIDTRSLWRFLAHPALLIPRSWRDCVYDWVAKNRHRFFPKNDCPLPSPDEREQMLP